ncbi:anthranilate phosphoribosyltransferase [Halarsenatibacter silvermanii]|uniref:Anthranilate phosphoribosyltransferase n=1 Tax=Halarsenatibacter silvermanii TaxID=321763 RepID=A0A1G9J5S9_9FIRM|nr:anthranilate phosphoribosyltransferase [Halarsenatibacter silvermanii]SDL32721.1 anthranilate phosphoribosyltransferase [Halarsenatibacter silvermanii]
MFNDCFRKVLQGENLTTEEMEAAMNSIMEGEVNSSALAGFLTALKIKGESIAEITGASRVMRDKALNVEYEGEVIDTCGTGGDGSNTFNISTTVTFVLAAAGLTVAKHGNRSVSSRSGSADVLEEMGVNLKLGPDQINKCLDEVNLGFLFAPSYHKAMKHAIEARKGLGIRTIFNILGPLTNPAEAEYQLLGVYDPELIEPMARTLGNLGVKRAMVVHGAAGLDELSLAGKNKVSFLHEDGSIENYTIEPEEAGLERHEVQSLKGGDPRQNKEIICSLLAGEERGAKLQVVLLNAAAALMVAGKVDNLVEGTEMADSLIESGRAENALQEFIEFTNKFDKVEAVS